MSQERNYMEFVFSPQGLAVDISNGTLKSDNGGFLYCSKIETGDISNNSITSDKLNPNISLSGLNVTVITGSSIYSDTISCDNLYLQNNSIQQSGQGSTGLQGSTGSQGLQGSTGLQGSNGMRGSNGVQGSTGSQGLRGATGLQGSTGSRGVTGTFMTNQDITGTNIYASTMSVNTDSFITSARIGQGSVSGFQNTVFGTLALDSSVTGSTKNTAINHRSLGSNSIGSYNTSIGPFSLANSTTGSNNISINDSSMRLTQSASFNTSIGSSAQYTNVRADNNIAIGYFSLTNLNKGATGAGYNNIGIGDYSLQYNVHGMGNIGIGYNSAGSIGNTGNVNSDNCTLIGSNTSSINMIQPNFYYRYDNSTAIGANAVISASNQIVLGDDSVTRVIIRNGSLVTPSSINKASVLYSSNSVTSITLSETSPQNIFLTSTNASVSTEIILPYNPITGTCFTITRFTNSVFNISVGTGTNGGNDILPLPRPSKTSSVTTAPVTVSTTSLYTSTSTLYGVWSIKLVHFGARWYVTNQVIN